MRTLNPALYQHNGFPVVFWLAQPELHIPYNGSKDYSFASLLSVPYLPLSERLGGQSELPTPPTPTSHAVAISHGLPTLRETPWFLRV